MFSAPACCWLAGWLAATGAQAWGRNVTDPDAPRALSSDGKVKVDVRWTDPAQFSEVRFSGNRWEAQRGDWVTQLATHFQQSAARQLPDGQHLSVTITDIRRAGQYEPWHGPRMQDVRVVKDIYPPRISFTYTLTGADGRVIDQGERKLVDSAFLMSGPRFTDSDPLRFEKAMIDDWVRKQFRSDHRTAGL
ncbi:membrane protein [Xanthomonas oryzae pv. oryzae]|nr:membrane protein [Xanthomonas oryzae pv. oryzae]OLI92963.1 membrane protein [Xanthomonas oryzae pv. oryzae]